MALTCSRHVCSTVALAVTTPAVARATTLNSTAARTATDSQQMPSTGRVGTLPTDGMDTGTPTSSSTENSDTQNTTAAGDTDTDLAVVAIVVCAVLCVCAGACTVYVYVFKPSRDHGATRVDAPAVTVNVVAQLPLSITTTDHPPAHEAVEYEQGGHTALQRTSAVGRRFASADGSSPSQAFGLPYAKVTPGYDASTGGLP